MQLNEAVLLQAELPSISTDDPAEAPLRNIGKPDAVRGCRGEFAIKQIRRDWQIVATIGRAHSERLGHDGPNAVPEHQPLNPTAAHAAALSLQHGMDPQATIAPRAVLVDAFDLDQQNE
jgi:hypothetical protein